MASGQASAGTVTGAAGAAGADDGWKTVSGGTDDGWKTVSGPEPEAVAAAKPKLSDRAKDKAKHSLTGGLSREERAAQPKGYSMAEMASDAYSGPLAIIGGAGIADEAATALKAASPGIKAGAKALAPVITKAARDTVAGMAGAYAAKKGAEDLGFSGWLSNVAGAIGFFAGARTLEGILGRETFEKIAYKAYEEDFGSSPKTGGEKLIAKGRARAKVNAAANAYKHETGASGATPPGRAPPRPNPASPAGLATEPKAPASAPPPVGTSPAAEGSSYSFTHPKESMTDVRKQLFSNTQQLTIPNDQVRVRFTQLHGHGISTGTYEEIQQFNEYIAKNGKLPGKEGVK